MVELAELLSALGTPARAGARSLLIPRYCLDGFGPLRSWSRNEYAFHRFGKSFRWRIWLMYDIKDLQTLEKLINEGSDDQLLKLREDKLETFWFVALVVGAPFYRLYEFVPSAKLFRAHYSLQ
jgi:hypothetical protein